MYEPRPSEACVLQLANDSCCSFSSLFFSPHDTHSLSLTQISFEKQLVPPELWGALYDFYHANKDIRTKENLNTNHSYMNSWDVHTTMTGPVAGDLHHMILAALTPILEEFTGIAIKPTYAYGMRRYLGGSYLRDHIDFGPDNVISAIINIDQVSVFWLRRKRDRLKQLVGAETWNGKGCKANRICFFSDVLLFVSDYSRNIGYR